MDDRSRPTNATAAAEAPLRVRPGLARVLALAVLLLAGPLGLPRGASGQAASNDLPPLAGSAWHTRDVDGGPLLFVVKGVGVRFIDGKNFSATVRFIDDQKTVKNGTYSIENGYVTFVIDGLGKQKARIWTEAGDLLVKDEAYDASARLVRGRMEDSGWF